MKHSLIAIATAFSVFAVSCGQKAQQPAARMDRNRINIGTYFLKPYANTPQHVKDCKDCGIDFVIGMPNDPAVLDIFQENGLGAVVGGVLPGWWGGDGSNAGLMCEKCPIEKYEEAAAAFQDHPAIWGVDTGDEPSALDFPHYGKVVTKVAELFPNQFPYLNLYPNYASVAVNTEDNVYSQLGTATYADHIAEYCKNVPLDYLCYDFYVYSTTVDKAYDNLKIVADACLETNRSMWIVLQVNSLYPEKWVSLNQLRFQAYTAMAFGAEVITWACYTAGWWSNQVLDDNGEKTEQYDKLKAVNAEIHSFSDVYMKYQRKATAFIGFDGTEWIKDIPTVSSLSDDTVCELCATDGTPLVAGSMVRRDGKKGSAVFVCSADDPQDENPQMHTVRFRPVGKKVKVLTNTGEVQPQKDADGFVTVQLQSNAAMIIY